MPDMDFPFVQSTTALALQHPLSTVLALIVLVVLATSIHNLYLHPLSRFPGPWYYAVSDVPYAISQLRGYTQYTLADHHARYGDIVRVGPNALTFTNPKAWEGIHGLRKGGIAAVPKDPLFHNEMLLPEVAVTRASDVDVVPIRRSMNAAFAAKNLLAQEPMLKRHIELLTSQLDAECSRSGDGSVDVRKWFTMSMFDINSEFGFGEDMGCVRSGKFHEWVQFVVDFFFAATLIHQCYKFWPLAPLLARFLPESARRAKEQHSNAALSRVRRRMAQDTDKPDFMTHFLKQAEKEKLSMDVIEAQPSVVILAGSETSAVGLTSTVYYVLAHPPVYKKMCDEIRSQFSTITDINLPDTQKLPYLHAVIWEALRIQSPLANGFTRAVPSSKRDLIVYDGIHIPPSTVVHVNHYAMNTSARNFRDPLDFVPERWLGESKYESDRRDASQPFLVGPRNCPGRNFALNNMKLALVYMVMTFDMELGEGMQHWDKAQKVYNSWLQPPLHVRLSKRA